MCLLSSLKLIVSLSVSSLLLIVGCAVEQGPGSSTHAAAGITGHVHGGQQPVAYSTVQLYTVGTAADGSAATPLLTQTSMSDANGNFSLSPGGIPLYSCTNATQVYITATGGYPSAGTANPDLAMMTALGPCSALTTGTFITINELTTVAAVSALAPYMSSATAIGAGSSDAAALDAAFKLASEFVDPSAGTAPGTSVSPGLSVPVSEIDTLADVVAACINSPGGTAGDSSACGGFFSLTTLSGGPPPNNTLTALLNLAENPALNTGSLYAMAVPSAPFQPTLTSAPPNFALYLTPDAGTAALMASPVSFSFPNTAVSFTSQPQTVTVTNSGAAAVTLGSIAIWGSEAADFAVSNGCPTMLAAGNSCSLQVTATPTANGARSAYLVVESSTPSSPQYVALGVTGTAPEAGPVTLTSGLSYTLAGTLQDLTLSNYGSTALTIKSIAETDTGTVAFPPSHDFSVTTNTCGTELAPQSVCTISVVSNVAEGSSQGFPETFTGSITVTDDASAGPQTASLTSTNVAALASSGEVRFSAPIGIKQTTANISYQSFNAYSRAPELTFAITGSGAADFSESEAENGNPVTFCSPMFPTYCEVTFSFTPTATGVVTAKATINGEGGQYLLLSATGVGDGPDFSISLAGPGSITSYLPNTIDPNGAGTETATITNTGSTTLSLTGSFSGPNAAQMSYGSSGCSSLAPQATCTATVQFNPIVVGPASATINIKDTNSTFSLSYPINAQASYWTPTASPTSLGFAAQALGTSSAAQTINVGDTNQYPLGHAITASLQPGSNFILTQGSSCVASTTQLCTFSVAFAPNQSGYISERMTVTDQTTQVSGSLPLYGTGSSAVASFSPTSVTFPQRLVNTTSLPAVVTLTNTGSTAMSNVSISVVGAVNGNFTQTNNCPATLAANGICTISVTFAPATAGSQSAMVQVTSTATNSPASFSVSGSAQ